MTKNWKTAAELMKELRADPEWVAAREKEEQSRRKRGSELRVAEQPILDDLRKIGYSEVQSVWDFVNTDDPYPDAVPILLHHLSKPYPGAVREGIARALSVPEARYACSQLIEAYRPEPPAVAGEMSAKQGLSVALAALADDAVIDDVLEVFQDKEECESRMSLVAALEKSKDPRATEALLALRDNPIVDGPDERKELEAIIERHLKSFKT